MLPYESPAVGVPSLHGSLLTGLLADDSFLVRGKHWGREAWASSPGGGAPSSSLYSDVKPQISRDISLKIKWRIDMEPTVEEAFRRVTHAMHMLNEYVRSVELRVEELEKELKAMKSEDPWQKWIDRHVGQRWSYEKIKLCPIMQDRSGVW
jgi:hypothetical protein